LSFFLFSYFILSVVISLLSVILDSTGASQAFRDFAEDYRTKNYDAALQDLSSGFSALSSSMGDCGINQVQHVFDAMALATKFAKVSKGIDKVDSIMVGASDLVKDVEKMAAACADGDSEAIGNAIGSFLNDWSQVVGGCGDKKGCQLVGGILRIIQEVAKDVGPCEDAIVPAITKMETARDAFKSKDYKSAVADFASALDILATTLQDSSCGVPKIGKLIGKLSPKLAKAVVKIENSNAVKILVESADIYDDLYKLVLAIDTKDWDTVGVELSNLLRVLRASGCSTKACIVLEGLMASIQQELSDFDQCMHDADRAWDNIAYAQQDFKNKHYKDGAQQLGHAMVTLAHAVSDCNIPGIAETAETMFNKLEKSTIANEIGEVIQLVVEGADVTLDINQAMLDFNAANWAGLGGDLGKLSEFIASTNCNSLACKIVEGILSSAGIVLKDLKDCKADLDTAITGFNQGAKQFENHGYSAAVKSWASALNTVSKAVTDCGLKEEMGYIEQEANVMGFANITDSKVARDINILIHGADFYEDLYASLKDIKSHDYRAMGGDLHKVMHELSQWTGKHSCSSDFCYIVVGIIEFIGDAGGDLKQCQADFKAAKTDFKTGNYEPLLILRFVYTSILSYGNYSNMLSFFLF
jgi:hypothetical protein